MANAFDRSRCAAYRDDLDKSLEKCEQIHMGGLRRDEVQEVTPDSVHSLAKDSSLIKSATETFHQVFLHYGPYEASGVVEHRLHRLRGMEERLRKIGYEVNLVPIDDWNAVELWVRGEQVFNCDIRDLDFGGDGLLDGLCLQAVDRVENAF